MLQLADTEELPFETSFLCVSKRSRWFRALDLGVGAQGRLQKAHRTVGRCRDKAFLLETTRFPWDFVQLFTFSKHFGRISMKVGRHAREPTLAWLLDACVPLAESKGGCHVVQKALEVAEPKHRGALVFDRKPLFSALFLLENASFCMVSAGYFHVFDRFLLALDFQKVLLHFEVYSWSTWLARWTSMSPRMATGAFARCQKEAFLEK